MRANSRLMVSLAKQLLGVIEDIASYDEGIKTMSAGVLCRERANAWLRGGFPNGASWPISVI